MDNRDKRIRTLILITCISSFLTVVNVLLAVILGASW